jgi:hypothetical protein
VKKTDPFVLRSLDGGIDDVFYNKFDVTWGKMNGILTTQRHWTRIPIEIADDDGTVDYNYNDDFFRCDNFTADHSNEKHILFAGCSQTEGVGAPQETVWTKILLNNLNKKNNTNNGFYSIGKSGYGWQKVITTYMIYIEKYGAPEYMFVLLPNLGRFYDWDQENEKYVYVQRYPNGGGVSTDQLDESKVPDFLLIEKPFTLLEHRKCFIDFAISWKLFEKFCESMGTKLLWGSWDYQENVNYKFADLSSNYIDISDEELLDFIREKRPDGKIEKFDLNRRDGHAGTLVNEYWAAKFQKEIEKRGWL